MDFATSSDPQVQAQLDRLGALSIPEGRLGLETVRSLLARLGDPHLQLPPVFHVAGTNGKGSTCAFLRAMLEADGKRVHVTTSPHLVRYNERIRLAGKLISDDALASVLSEVLDAGEDLSPSFFEVTIAAAFLAFSREPADACIVEVGLGGRFDATNVLEGPIACAIAALGIDHERFLLAPEDGVPTDPISRIAFEKAGIAKPGSPLVTLSYADGPTLEIQRAAARRNCLLSMRGRDWHSSIGETGLHYADRHGELALPLPALAGAHQAHNAALAIAMLRHQDHITVSRDAMATGLRTAQWPARMQRLNDGPITRLAPEATVLLDGGHNDSAASVMAAYLEQQSVTGAHAILGMLKGKDSDAMIAALAPHLASLTAVPVPGHDYQQPVHLAAAARVAGVPIAHTAPSVEAAIAHLAAPVTERPGTFGPPIDGTILIAGSLYLAGLVLIANEEEPD